MRMFEACKSKFLAAICSRACRIDINNTQDVGDAEARISRRLRDITISNLIEWDYCEDERKCSRVK